MNWVELFSQMNSGMGSIDIFVRCVLLFFGSILLLRFGNHRYQLNTTIDLLLVIILGGIVSRGINGSATLISTFVAMIALILSHKGFVKLAFLSRPIESLLKGKSHRLMYKGQFEKQNLCRFNITEADLKEQLHHQLNRSNFHEIEEAILERNGGITFILNSDDQDKCN